MDGSYCFLMISLSHYNLPISPLVQFQKSYQEDAISSSLACVSSDNKSLFIHTSNNIIYDITSNFRQ
jgi:hypothetical protein